MYLSLYTGWEGGERERERYRYACIYMCVCVYIIHSVLILLHMGDLKC